MPLNNNELPPALPPELYEGLSDMHPDSHEFKEGLQAAQDLAMESGYRALDLSDIFPPKTIEPPAGYNSELLVPGGLSIDTNQITERISGFQTGGETIDVDVHRLVTDMGNQVQYCDLLPFMSRTVQSSEVREHNKGKIEKAFYRDLKIIADGIPGMRNVVQCAQGVYYSRASRNTKARRYWMDVAPSDDDTRTFAIIGENPDNINAQRTIYRQLFNANM